MQFIYRFFNFDPEFKLFATSFVKMIFRGVFGTEWAWLSNNPHCSHCNKHPSFSSFVVKLNFRHLDMASDFKWNSTKNHYLWENEISLYLSFVLWRHSDRRSCVYVCVCVCPYKLAGCPISITIIIMRWAMTITEHSTLHKYLWAHAIQHNK